MNDLCRWLLREAGFLNSTIVFAGEIFAFESRGSLKSGWFWKMHICLWILLLLSWHHFTYWHLWPKKKKKRKMWFGRYFVYTVAKFCLSCLVPLNHTVYSSMHSSLAFQYLLWKPKFLLWAIFAGSASKGATALLHANLWSSGEEYLS